MLWGVLAAAFAVGWAEAASDPGLSGVKRLTPSGYHSSVKFSDDGRFVYVTGRGSQYNTACEHVYRYDRADPPLAPSLVSTGIGQESGAAWRKLDSKTNSQIGFTTTAAYAFRKLRATPNADFNEKIHCPASKCSGTIENPVKAACRVKRRNEYFEGATTVFAWKSGITGAFGSDPNAYEVLGDFVEKKSIWSEKRGATAQKQNILITDKDGEKKPIASSTLWSNGFSISAATGRAYYAGAPSSPTAKTSVPRGVVPLTGSRIYAVANLAEGAKEELLLQSDDFDYFQPAISPTDPTVLLAVRKRPDGKATIVKVKLSADGMKAEGEPEALTDEDADSWAPAISPDGKFVGFVSDRDSGSQVYVGTLGTVERKPTIERSLARPFGPLDKFVHLKYTVLFGLERGIPMGPITKARISDKQVLFRSQLEADGCGHIFQLDLELRDQTIYRKLSTGVHSYGGASQGYMHAVVEADLHREITADGCKPNTCLSPTDATMGKLCKESKRTRHLPKTSELYLVNSYGSIIQRLTTGDRWVGESRTSYDGRLLAYVKKAKSPTFELWLMNLDTQTEKQLERDNDVGFIFDIAFSADNKKLTYAVYYPTTTEEFREKLDYNFVDIRRSNVYVYDIESKKEKQIGVNKDVKGEYWRSPNFHSGTDQLLFLTTMDGSLSNMWRCRLTGTEDCVDLGRLWITENADFSIQGSNLVFSSEAGVFYGKFGEETPPVTEAPETTPAPDSAVAVSLSLMTLLGIFALRWI